MKSRASKLLATLALPALLLTLNSHFSTARAQGTAFTYQGQLASGGTQASGSFDLTFSLFNASTGGSPVAGPSTNSGVGVSNGLFAVTLDFGSGVFTGVNYWLEIAVRTNGGGGFTILAPRQQLLPTPYAIFANTASNLSGTLPAGQLTGTLNNNQLASNSVTVSAGTGLSGGGTVVLGGSTTLNNSGVISLTGNADITASPASGAVTLGDTATSANTANRIVKRDGSGNFSAGSATLGGNLILPSTTASIGIIYSGTATLLHTFGSGNTFAGVAAGNLTMSGTGNTGFGLETLHQNTTGTASTAVGQTALFNNTDGGRNVAVGFSAMLMNTDGLDDTALGFQALLNNTTGDDNTASGSWAMDSNTSGSQNTASGYFALYGNTNGQQNCAFGMSCLESNLNGSGNAAIGAFALSMNTSGQDNTASGSYALNDNTSGYYNTACGSGALYANTVSAYNTAVGAQALQNVTNGSDNIALGYYAGYSITNGSGNIDIGSQGASTDSYIIRIGGGQSSTFIAGISGVTISPAGAPVYVNSLGQLGTINSSQRFKEDIQNMGDASDVLLSLRPVTFRYKPELDPERTPQFGLVAEEVSKVDPDLVLRNEKREIYTVRYEAVNAMLLNEFLKEHRKVEAQSAEMADMKARLEKLEQLIESKK